MAQRAKKPAPTALSLSPWVLCIWRGEIERCHFALVRWEFHYPVPGQQPKMHGVQAMFVDGNGCVEWKHYPAEWRTAKGEMRHTAELAVPTLVKTTMPQMMEYFKRRLLLVGGHPKAYEAMGIPKPVMTQVEGEGDPKKQADLNELYQRAAKLLDTPVADLRKKYEHLNRGLQAMNLRNRLRAKGHNV